MPPAPGRQCICIRNTASGTEALRYQYNASGRRRSDVVQVGRYDEKIGASLQI